MDGIIIVNKEADYTSHRAVQEIRHIFKNCKAGHSGTLDPMAKGVLPVCLGRATRLVEYIIEMPKTYSATATLGLTTDTGDATGIPVEKNIVPPFKKSDIESALNNFRGEIEQEIPSFSAAKYKGKPFYYWTRSGQSIPRRKRKAFIYEMELMKYVHCANPGIEFRVKCSKGTYIRTLATDLGEFLGCGAHLSSLTRDAVGPFIIENAHFLEEIKTLAHQGCYDQFIINMDAALLNLKPLTLQPVDIKRLKNGQLLTTEAPELLNIDLEEGLKLRIYDPEGNFIAIAACSRKGDLFELKTVKYLSG